MLRDLLRDLRVAARVFRSRPGFGLVAVVTVALAIGAATVVFGVVRGTALRALPYHDPDRLVTIWPDHFFSHQEVLYLQEHTTVFEDVGAWVPGWNMTLTGSGDPLKLAGSRVTANMFAVLGVGANPGRSFRADDAVPGADNVVVLSAGLWHARFGGDPSIVGRDVVLDGTRHLVVGVMPAGFELYQPQTQAWRVLARDPTEWYQTAQALMAVGRLRPGATLQQAQSELTRLVAQMRETFGLPDDYGSDAHVASMKQWLVGPLRPMLLVAVGAAGCLLLLACANLANLLLARGAGREREVAVRRALGASRERLVRHLLAESAVLAVAGGVVGVLLARWGIVVAKRALPAATPFAGGLSLDPLVLGVSAALVIGTAIVCGVAPAVVAVRGNTQAVLRGAFHSGVGLAGWRTRSALVLTQVAIGMVLLAGTALMIQSLRRLQAVDPGFRTDGLLTLALQPTGANFQHASDRLAFYDQVYQRLEALPGVSSVGAIQHLPLAGVGWLADVDVEGRPLPTGATPPRVGWRIVDADYFATLGIPLLEGRTFEPQDQADAPSVLLVNRTMARELWKGESPIGRRVRAGNATRDGWATVVGVVGDIRHNGLDADPFPELYQPFAQNDLGGMTLVVRTTVEPHTLARTVVDAVWSVDRDVPITAIRPMADVVYRSVASRRTVFVLLGLVSLVGLVLALVGTYGIVAHHVAARTREIGIRIAIGATPTAVVGASVGEGMRLAAAGVIAGAGLALVTGRWLRAFVFGVPVNDPVTLASVAVVLIGVTALASYLPARRAARVDPVTALREE
ncbi:MAG: ABC transporter permease [Gemmatimonadales bacterium]|jgi:predicted permease